MGYRHRARVYGSVQRVFRSGNRLIVRVWFYLRLIHSVAIC